MCVDCGLLFADDTKKREPDEVTILQSDLTLNIKRMTDLVGANETYEFVSALLKQPDHLETTIKEPNQWGDD